MGTLLRRPHCRKVGSACGVRIPASRESTVTRAGAQRRAGEQIKADPPRPRHARRWAMALAPAAPNTEGALVEIRSVRKTETSMARRHSRVTLWIEHPNVRTES